MNPVVIVQARMTSTRLPGKILSPILGRPMLSFQMERLKRVRSLDRIVVATTTNATDDVVQRFCADEGVACFRGSEQDVLSRYYAAATHFGADAVVRVTSDCPLLDPDVVDRVWSEYLRRGGCDYASNMLEPTYPYGMAVEAFCLEALAEAHARASDPAEREHVTPYIYWRPERFRLRSVRMEPDLSAHRWTVDTPEDFRLVSLILESLYPTNPEFALADVVRLVEAHPHWEEINRNVLQRSVERGGEIGS